MIRRWLVLFVVSLWGCGGGGGDDDGPPGADAAVERDAGLDAALADDAAVDAGTEPLDPIGPVVVSASGDSDQESEPTIVVTASGRVVVAWMGFVAGRPQNFGASISEDLGETFGEVQILTPPDGRLAADPVLTATADGTVWFVFEGFFPPDRPGALPEDSLVYAARMGPDEQSFGAPVLVSGPERVFNDKPWVTVTGRGTLLATWVFEQGGFITSMVARSEDGATWEPALLDDRQTFHELYAPCAPPDGDRVYIVYFGQFGVGLRASDDDGLTWPSEDDTLVSRPADGVIAFDDPRCVAAGDDVWVSYAPAAQQWTGTTAALLDDVLVAHSSDGGATFDDPVAVPDGAGMFMHPQLARQPSGALDVIYYMGADADDPAATLRHARSTDSGASFAPSTLVKEPVTFWSQNGGEPWLGDYEGLTAWSNTAFAAFADNESGNAHISFWRH